MSVTEDRDEDGEALERLGYQQELKRVLARATSCWLARTAA
jgi:hypothetical protein